ncbi:hypothetical protein [Klebsiella sp. BIGb0407]|uniref:hypothetical protein n=1 Tax=Klebsiella sp. BIGb0407 TaxID=2940603 RepID=UPI002166DFBE|nr:hypothetical protein [Klebsiella sp. BIGb0407]MCS3432359.1 hypothetical protein [Klebsiella sp. BIGb0407]
MKYIRTTWKKKKYNNYEIQEITGINNNICSIISFLADKHRNLLYQSLYESGNSQYNEQKAWDIIRHIFPFYDCVENIISNGLTQTIPSCLMNAVMFIPDFGTTISLKEQFGLELAPSGQTILQSIIPDFEPITDISKTFRHRVINLIFANNKTASIVEKIISSDPAKKMNIIIFFRNRRIEIEEELKAVNYAQHPPQPL